MDKKSMCSNIRTNSTTTNGLLWSEFSNTTDLCHCNELASKLNPSLCDKTCSRNSISSDDCRCRNETKVGERCDWTLCSLDDGRTKCSKVDDGRLIECDTIGWANTIKNNNNRNRTYPACPCSNGGTRSRSGGVASNRCRCLPGFSGSSCEFSSSSGATGFMNVTSTSSSSSVVSSSKNHTMILTPAMDNDLGAKVALPILAAAMLICGVMWCVLKRRNRKKAQATKKSVASSASRRPSNQPVVIAGHPPAPQRKLTILEAILEADEYEGDERPGYFRRASRISRASASHESRPYENPTCEIRDETIRSPPPSSASIAAAVPKSTTTLAPIQQEPEGIQKK